MRFDPEGPVAVLSPHLDDAVLSTFAVLTTAPVVVVNVFDGIPDSGPSTAWDRICGFDDPVAHSRARLAEDAAVLSSLGVASSGLGLVDADHREKGSLGLAHVVSALAGVEVGVSAVLAPVAGGPSAHPDHRLVRDAARILSGCATVGPSVHREIPVGLYADFPHAAKGAGPLIGYPAAWGGTVPDPPWLRALLRDVPELDSWLGTEPYVLGPDEREAKLEAMRGYVTQYRALDRGLRRKGIVSDPELYGREFLWPLGRRPPLPLSF